MRSNGTFDRSWATQVRCCACTRSPSPASKRATTPSSIRAAANQRGKVVREECYSNGVLQEPMAGSGDTWVSRLQDPSGWGRRPTADNDVQCRSPRPYFQGRVSRIGCPFDVWYHSLRADGVRMAFAQEHRAGGFGLRFLRGWWLGDYPWPSVDARRRADLVIRFMLTATAISGFFSVFYALVLSFMAGSAVLLVASTGFLLCVRVVVAGGSPVRAGNLAMALGFSVIGYIACQRNDLPAPVLMYLAVMPLVSEYVAGKRWTRVWSVAALIVIVACAARFACGLATSAVSPSPEQIVVADTAGLIGLVIMVWQLARSIGDRRARAEDERLTLLANLHQLRGASKVTRLATVISQDLKKPLAWVSDAIEGALEALQPPAKGSSQPASLMQASPSVKPEVTRPIDSSSIAAAVSALKEAQEGILEMRHVVERLQQGSVKPDDSPTPAVVRGRGSDKGPAM
jgi:hypothetical protein